MLSYLFGREEARDAHSGGDMNNVQDGPRRESHRGHGSGGGGKSRENNPTNDDHRDGIDSTTRNKDRDNCGRDSGNHD
eukprot:CAMPEP_0171407578 /NCGR_PEP_ID=MMETSP0880-20121228/20277_1 /TAXON_ID=67004 /ORGANISM="Thalassiosira weissflogii, Strain CCMP1336" /LENGTH=77 /DNA_ID=CAMNT_0011923567 /DNA_START=125 /DNA_END=355 /DNA_ORIENTATION=+